MDGTGDIGQALRRFRIGARINQGAMAQTLGVSQSQVSRWESGRDTPRPHNIEAIAALIWGRRRAEIEALAMFVRGAQAPLVLFDDQLAIVEASAFLRLRGGPLKTFGWLFDCDINPALPAMAARMRGLAESAAVLALAIPFSHEDRPWACKGRLTLTRIGGALYALGELSFVRDDKERVRAIEVGVIGA
ncbi:helix-turn-helix domain-containing protein [Pelagibacterium luteolum]|uniref:Helix-turn-helix domain-containing protein n=1 Tax=Pelagibacterium luteolum TaxID=440168 RepID=A0A1G7SQ84_9HYPH|nr:helix-turn-helix transcriptional regulator [Pelagibacterium luteolum]SDG25193.1 Helix-turn-helix domain-containing protein [Pelagibacterium luteolum]